MTDDAALVDRAHKAGGKTKMRLKPGVTGGDYFVGARHEHRLWLSREWEPDATVKAPKAYVLWIGMNPSVADRSFDDLTCLKEQNWTRSLGYCRYYKTNVGSLCATQPDDLLAPGLEVCHYDNIGTILRLADTAGMIVLATGELPKPLVPFFDTLLAALKERGLPLYCLGKTKTGFPKHTSRLPYATPFEEYAQL